MYLHTTAITIFFIFSTFNASQSLNTTDSRSLVYYNFLRNILNKNDQTTIDHSDFLWVDQVKHALLPYTYKTKGIGHPVATDAQKEMIAHAQAVLNMTIPLAIVGEDTRTMGKSFGNGLSLCLNPDLDTRLGTLYHELGHINQHNKKTSARNMASYFNTVTRHLNTYRSLAARSFDQSTTLGRYINRVLKKFPENKGERAYWNRPVDKKTVLAMRLKRIHEKIADLFMLEELFKQNIINPILYKIHTRGMSKYIVVDPPTSDSHPSHFERALYMAGFLVAHGIDINKAIKEWENKGTCTDSEKTYSPWTLGKHSSLKTITPGSLDALYAYQKWQQLYVVYDYVLWKKNLLAHWDKEKMPLSLQKKDLLHQLAQSYSILKNNGISPSAEKEALFAYNFLRELSNLTTVIAIKNIDQEWLIAENNMFRADR